MKKVFFFFKQVQKELRGKVIYLETRNLFDYSRYKEIIQESGWFYQPHLNYQLALVGLTKDNLLTVFDNDVRRRIKNSISAGATYGICESGSEFELLYNILEHLYHEKVRLPLPSFDFFKNLYGSGILKVFVVKHQGNIIGGSFCPYDKNGIYTFYYCDKRYYNKRISPTHLSILSAMEFAIEQGIPNFDFMGAGKPGIPFGVRDFKKQFGGDLVENGRFINIINPLLYNLGKTGLKVLSKINL